eukprot:CAMPEP_0180197924 /NCGR_PEP_ID=MMETSP0987-20121128/4892_1 /TAXON_ID=697907 /ORGANISM="non described non described, Strain CCMP2293" /LENGTH=45 /DNA_ID= /DNA_START= /DNA_END= /DNA_ORIENTATION=
MAKAKKKGGATTQLKSQKQNNIARASPLARPRLLPSGGSYRPEQE